MRELNISTGYYRYKVTGEVFQSDHVYLGKEVLESDIEEITQEEYESLTTPDEELVNE